MANWLDLSNNANTFKSSYFNGFIDVSGTIQNRNVNDRLIICGDASLNSELSIAKRLFVSDIEIGHGGNNLGTNLTIGTNILENAVTTVFASDKNVAIGFNVFKNAAKTSNDHTYDNVAIGYDSMANSKAGDTNVAIGQLSMGQTQGKLASNVAVGFWALKGPAGSSNLTISHNVALGYSSGMNNNGSFNTFIGSNTNNNNATSIQFSTAVGYGAEINENNQIMLGRSSEKVVIPGDASFNNRLFVNGVGTFSAPPECSVVATSDNQLVNKSYVDTNSVSLSASNTFTGATTVFDNNSAKVGIKTTNPQSALDVNGQIRGDADGDTASFFGRAAIGYNGTSNFATFAHYDYNNTTQYALGQNSSGGTIINSKSGAQGIRFRIDNVGKMQLTDGGSLQVAYDTNTTSFFGRAAIGYTPTHDDSMTVAHVDNNSHNNYALRQNAQGATFMNSADGQVLTFRINNSTVKTLNSSGTFGSSDDRLKTDEQYITNATETIMKLSPQIYKKYLRMDLSDHYGIQSGFIAQDIWYNAPELRHLVYPGHDASGIKVTPNELPDGVDTLQDIQDDPDYNALNWGETEVGVDYEQIIAYLVGSIQEQQSVINTEKTKTASLEAQVASLLERVAALES